MGDDVPGRCVHQARLGRGEGCDGDDDSSGSQEYFCGIFDTRADHFDSHDIESFSGSPAMEVTDAIGFECAARKALYLQRDGVDVWVGVLIGGFDHVWHDPICEYDIVGVTILA